MKCTVNTMKAWAGLLLGVQKWADWSLNVWKCEGRTEKQWRCEWKERLCMKKKQNKKTVIKQTQLQQNIIDDYINLTEWDFNETFLFFSFWCVYSSSSRCQWILWTLLQIQDAVPKTSLRLVLVTWRLPQSPAVCMEDCLQTAPWALCKTEIGTSKWKLCFDAPTKTSEKAQLLLVKANVLCFRSGPHLLVSL